MNNGLIIALIVVVVSFVYFKFVLSEPKLEEPKK